MLTPVRQKLKRALQRFPVIWDPLQTMRFFRYCRAKFGSFQEEFQRDVYENGAITVLYGPFRGTRYYNKIVWGPITPKWIGSYEAELHPAIEEIKSKAYGVVVDVGAAEGYYAVGLAVACPHAKVITYDIDFIARRRQRELAALNGLGQRLDVRRRCDHRRLDADLAAAKCLVICDIEGMEIDLIDPTRAPNLLRADVLVECHRTNSLSVADVAAAIVARFAGTHRIEQIGSRSRILREWSAVHPALEKVSPAQLAFAIDEFRYPQQWLWMKCK